MPGTPTNLVNLLFGSLTKLLGVMLLYGVLPLAAQVTPYIDLAGEWKKDGGEQIQFPEPGYDVNPHGVYVLRRTVYIPERTDTSALSIAVGTIRGAFRLSVNEAPIGETERYAERYEPALRYRVFKIPPGTVRAGERASLTLEVTRRWSQDHSLQPGRFVIASDQAARDVSHLNTKTLQLNRASNLMFLFLELLFTVLTLLVARQWESWRGAVWLAAFFLASALQRLLVYTVAFHAWPDAITSAWIGNWPFVTRGICLAEFAVGYLQPPFRWWRLAIYPPFLTLLISDQPLLYWSWLLLVLLAIRWIWTSSQVAASVAIGLYSLTELLISTRAFNIGPTIHIGAMLFSTTSLFRLVLGIGLLLLLVQRLLRDRQRQERLGHELEAAREVQQLLVSGSEAAAGASEASGFRTECVYLPADETSGDFYQVLDAGESRTLVVIGDVSGKGLRAALLTALLVGVIRDRRTEDPAALLGHMNRVLLGATGGFTTCCVLLCECNGQTSLACAGHPAPFYKGLEMDVSSGPPLGVDDAAKYEATPFHWEPGAQLTLYSDGVIEAANPSRELFGFERTRTISNKPAKEIAEAARNWGQNDDITVVTVRRMAA